MGILDAFLSPDICHVIQLSAFFLRNECILMYNQAESDFSVTYINKWLLPLDIVIFRFLAINGNFQGHWSPPLTQHINDEGNTPLQPWTFN